MEIKKAVIPAAGLGTRFLPLTKILAKEIIPLVDFPLINYSVEEAVNSGINQVDFIISENKSIIPDFFKKNVKIESFLNNGKQNGFLEILKKIDKKFEEVSFFSCLQKIPKGDGDSILKVKNFVKKENFAVLFPDDVFDSKIPALVQLEKIFQTSQKTVVGLKKISQEKIPFYGMVGVEKIANRLYKIKSIKEKPEPSRAPSDLAIVGRYILTPEIFPYLKKVKPNKKGEIILAEAFNLMIEDGKVIYGYDIDGEWLECGNKLNWIKSNFYLCLNHPEYGPVLKEFLKKII